jgi:hypothetical protein
MDGYQRIRDITRYLWALSCKMRSGGWDLLRGRWLSPLRVLTFVRARSWSIICYYYYYSTYGNASSVVKVACSMNESSSERLTHTSPRLINRSVIFCIIYDKNELPNLIITESSSLSESVVYMLPYFSYFLLIIDLTSSENIKSSPHSQSFVLVK